jgi:hypothetical protein
VNLDGRGLRESIAAWEGAITGRTIDRLRQLSFPGPDSLAEQHANLPLLYYSLPEHLLHFLVTFVSNQLAYRAVTVSLQRRQIDPSEASNQEAITIILASSQFI